MSRELECLERYHNLDVLKENENGLVLEDKEEYNTLKQALQRLDAIDNAKPSEALEDLDEIENYCEWSEFNSCLSHDFPKEYNTIKQALIKEQEMEKEDARYKQLEEQLGCSLDVYVKLHQQMKFYRLNALNEIIECEIDNPNDDEVYHIQADGIIFNQYDYGWQFYPFKDYKKTWWLKEDKSE